MKQIFFVFLFFLINANNTQAQETDTIQRVAQLEKVFAQNKDNMYSAG